MKVDRPIPADPTQLPPIISGWEVCALARISKATLAKWIKSGKMPAPVHQGRDGQMWRRDEVLVALGLLAAATNPLAGAPDPWL